MESQLRWRVDPLWVAVAGGALLALIGVVAIQLLV